MNQIKDFPSISRLEFADACKALEDRSSDRLEGTDWVSVKWTGSELLIKQRKNINSDQQVPGGEDNSIPAQEIVEELTESDTVSGA